MSTRSTADPVTVVDSLPYQPPFLFADCSCAGTCSCECVCACACAVDQLAELGNQFKHPMVTVAVALPRLNSEHAYELADSLTVTGHENVAVLQASRCVADWFRTETVYQVIGTDPMPAPVQIVTHENDLDLLRTAAVLWDPYTLDGPYSSFETALQAARRLTR